MNKITVDTAGIALDVLYTAFKDNPGVLWVVKKDKRLANRIRVLCKHCLNVSIEKDGAYITSDKKGVALVLKSWKKQRFHNWLIGYFKLGQYCIGWNRALSMIKREKKIQSRRPNTPYLYFWMLGVIDHSNGLQTIKEIRDFIFQYARHEKLPIYAETTLQSTLNLYLRYGFEIYDTWQSEEQGITVYFIRRDYDQD